MYQLAKKAFLKVVPKTLVRRLEPTIRSVLYHLFYKGSAHYCGVCRSNLSRFIAHNHLGFQDAICPNCGSLARTRTLVKLLESEFAIQGETARLLEFSPHRSTFSYFSNLPNILYTANDFEDEFLAHTKHDITQLPFDDFSYQFIICYHVLEHVPNDLKAMQELFRVLDNQGIALLQVPFLVNESTVENPAYNTPELRLKHYGQADHVRYYGLKDFIAKLDSVGFNCTQLSPNTDLFDNAVEREQLKKSEIVIVARKD